MRYEKDCVEEDDDFLVFIVEIDIALSILGVASGKYRFTTITRNIPKPRCVCVF